MVPSEAYAGRRAGYERVLMPKEERNKWTAWRVLRVYAVVTILAGECFGFNNSRQHSYF